MRKKSSRSEDLMEVADSFAMDVVNDLMTYYNCDFDTVDVMLTKVGYWNVLNDDELACVAAHDYTIEELVNDIERVLKE